MSRSETSAPTPARDDARTHLSARKFVATERDILACLPRARGDQACSTPGPRTRVTRATRAPQTPRARPGGSLSADSSKKRVARRNRHRLQLDGCVTTGTDALWIRLSSFRNTFYLARSLHLARLPEPDQQNRRRAEARRAIHPESKTSVATKPSGRPGNRPVVLGRRDASHGDGSFPRVDFAS